MSYVHPDDRNLTNLHKAMEYDASGKPVIRTSIAGGNVVITGDVTIPATVNVSSSSSDPVHVHLSEVGTSGVLETPYLPVGGNVTISNTPNVRLISNAVTVTGTVSISSLPEVEIKNDSGNAIPVVGNVRVVNDANSVVRTVLADSANLSAFSRLRVTERDSINEYKTIYGLRTYQREFINRIYGGGNVSFNANASTTTLSVGVTNGDYAIRQTREYHSYKPGAGQLILATGMLAPTKTNLTQRVGYFDDRNGIYFERATNNSNVTVNSWNIRNDNGGSPILAETAPQDQWNIDRFDGSGPSGITLDTDTVQIWLIDFQWLGVGRVRVGFDINGEIFYAHEFNHANVITSTYMSQPSLPVRYEILNTGTTAGGSNLIVICSAVQSEGGTDENAPIYSISSGTTGVTVSTTEQVVMALRLKNTLGPGNKPNRATAQLINYNLFATQACAYRVHVGIGQESLFSNSPTWGPANAISYCEYTSNVALAPGWEANSVCFSSGYVSTAQGSAVGSAQNALRSKVTKINQNYDSTSSEILFVTAVRMSNQDSTVYATLDWQELS